MEYKELKGMSPEQLNKKAQELKKSLFEMRMKNTVGQLNNPLEIRDARKTIARVMTALNATPVAPKASKAPKAPKAKGAKTTKAPKRAKKK